MKRANLPQWFIFLGVVLLIALLLLRVQCTPQPTPDEPPPKVTQTKEKPGPGEPWPAGANDLVDKYVLTVAIDADGTQWFGTPEGVSEFDGKNWITYTIANGLVNNHVSAIGFDNKGSVWFGTLGGASRLQENSWTAYTRKEGLADNDVRAIAVDDTGVVWFGTLGGVSRFDGQDWTTYTVDDGLVDNSVLAVAIDQQGNKWFGTLKGVSKFDGSTWTTYNTKNSGLAHNAVVAIAVDQRNHKWFGTWGGGISQFDGEEWVSYNPVTANLAGFLVNALAVDQQGNLWAGTDHGLNLYHGEKWLTYNTVDGLSNNQVRAVAIDADGKVVAGTWGGGVSSFDRPRISEEGIGPEPVREPTLLLPRLYKPQVASSPEQTLRAYWEAVSNSDYETAWNGLSLDFRQRKHADSYTDYLQGYRDMKLCSVDANNVWLVQQSDDHAVVYAHLVYRTGSECTASEYDFDFHLIRDQVNKAWLIDKLVPPGSDG